MAEKYDMDTDTVHRVTYALQDLSLFTEKEGSMPPYRYRLQIEQASLKPNILSDFQTRTGKTDQDIPPQVPEKKTDPPQNTGRQH